MHQLFDMVKDNEGSFTKELIAKFGLVTGCKRTTRMEYLQDLVDSGAVVEAAHHLWTHEAYYSKVQEKLEAENRAEEAAVKVATLEAYDFERT